MATEGSDSSANLLLNLIDGYRVTAVIYVTARLGIADLLLEGSKSAPDLARLTDTHKRSLLRLMRALVTLALCTEESDGTFKLTQMGTHLAANAERSLKAWALFEGGLFRAVWSNLIELNSHRQDRGRAGRRQWPGTLRGFRKDEARRLVQRSHGLPNADGCSGGAFGV